MADKSLKVSVSLPVRDMDLIAQLKQAGLYSTTSAVIHAGLDKLRDDDLAAQYAEAFSASDAKEWSSVEADGWQ